MNREQDQRIDDTNIISSTENKSLLFSNNKPAFNKNDPRSVQNRSVSSSNGDVCIGITRFNIGFISFDLDAQGKPIQCKEISSSVEN